MALTADEHEAMALLEDWHRRLQAVLALIEAKRSLAEIHEAYTAVKRRLESECRTRFREKQNEASERWLKLTFHEAKTHLRAPVNGQPGEIATSLYEASGDFSHEIHSMRTVDKGGTDAT